MDTGTVPTVVLAVTGSVITTVDIQLQAQLDTDDDLSIPGDARTKKGLDAHPWPNP